MQKIITALIILVFTTVINAQSSSEEKRIQQTIDTFFKGLHSGDSTLIKQVIHTDIKIQTTATTKENKKYLQTETKEQLLKMIASKPVDKVYLEKLLSCSITIDGNLASVWTPYEFYVDGKFSHCGANSFQLFDNNGKWKIIYLVDMRRRQDCEALKK